MHVLSLPHLRISRKFTRKSLPLMLQLFLGSKASVITYRSDQASTAVHRIATMLISRTPS
jgi:hypothetical protein